MTICSPKAPLVGGATYVRPNYFKTATMATTIAVDLIARASHMVVFSLEKNILDKPLLSRGFALS